jgi:hypothetical protein
LQARVGASSFFGDRDHVGADRTIGDGDLNLSIVDYTAGQRP